MLDINLEFVRGMLFVRLNGRLDNNTYTKLKDCLDDMINDKGLKYFVINLKELSYIDEQGLQLITDRYLDVVNHDGKLIICGYDKQSNTNIKVNSILNKIEHTNNELTALKLINI